jgi:hypothetical protein
MPEFSLLPEPEPPPASLRGTETVLVVEDQQQLCKMAGRVLRSYGYRVIEAANPGEALLDSERHVATVHGSHFHIGLYRARHYRWSNPWTGWLLPPKAVFSRGSGSQGEGSAWLTPLGGHDSGGG